MTTLEPHGTVFGATFDPLEPVVVVTATVAVTSEPLTLQEQVSASLWERFETDPALRASYDARLRDRLAAALADRLTPTITVQSQG